ncbi:lipoate--protein ligase family protein [Ferviditalea candida]|uniref:Biotin/lipoate A/B protein ligase family protein n=1 Tax=Ferviditalea candida TaxID=3108399 RepID=A0ABU5ZCD5_9BACL|nr:biotin/lipoate A/B protein ligase family protein [Paenibacillaceae bacterium T2]
MTTWRFILSGACSPAYNMAVDEAILTVHSEGRVPPTLRFYGWEPASLSIGYFQKAEDELDFDAIRRHGTGFVRRPTGGRAVLHDRELTYSIVVSEEYPGMPSGITEAYRVLSTGLLHGFRRLGLDAQMVNLSSEEEKMKYAAGGSAACFDSPSWYELVVEGRKVAGSAQTRQKGAILQHGSILIELDTDRLFELLQFPNERIRQRLKTSFSQKAVAINELRRSLLMPPATLPEVETAFRQGFAEGLDIRLEQAELTSYEQELAETLVAEKYSRDEWNLRR